MATMKKQENPVQRMIKTKTALIARLHKDIRIIRQDAEHEIQRVQSRIRIADALLKALRNGALKP